MKEKIKKTIPNIITLSRIASLILGSILFMKNKTVLSFCIYLYGAISDALDGYLARKWNAYSKIGGYLDATCDKLYVLSIIIISIIHENYSIILILILEAIIAVINYITIRKQGSCYTERVGKFKMTFEFTLLIIALLMIKIKYLWYIYIIIFVLTVYFEIQCINAYINQKNNKKSGLEIDYNGKNSKEKSKLLLKEFKYYLLHPVKIVK